MHPRYPHIYFNFLEINAMCLMSDNTPFQEVYSPCVLRAQACRLKVVGKNAQAWGLRFDRKIILSRRPYKLHEQSNKTSEDLWEKLRSEAIRSLRSIIQDIRKSRDVQSMWSMRQHVVYRGIFSPTSCLISRGISIRPSWYMERKVLFWLKRGKPEKKLE